MIDDVIHDISIFMFIGFPCGFSTVFSLFCLLQDHGVPLFVSASSEYSSRTGMFLGSAEPSGQLSRPLGRLGWHDGGRSLHLVVFGSSTVFCLFLFLLLLLFSQSCSSFFFWMAGLLPHHPQVI